MRITYRPVKKEDFPFLKNVYYSTREHELTFSGWTEEQKQQFIEFQFNAQHAHYTSVYKKATFKIVIFNKNNIGRLYFEETDKQIRIIDISLLPKYRGKGIGTCILNALKQKANLSCKKLNLHVNPNNPALKLYKKLGFIVVEKKDIHFFMEYSPA